MEDKSKKIAFGIIIPFYEGTPYFDRLFISIKKATQRIETKAQVSILVIDNSESDNTDFFKSYDGQIIYLRQEKRLGYGRACNVGYRYCQKEKFDFIQIVNQDGYFDEYCLGRLLNVMQNNLDVTIASSIPLTYVEQELEPFFIKYYLQYAPDLVTDLLKKNLLQKDGYETIKIPGICFMLRLNGPFQDANLFDENIFMYFEDEDLCKRVIESNQKIVLVPGAFFYHQHAHTTDKINHKEIDKQNEISEKYFRLKHSKNKMKSFYGLAVDDIFDSLKQLFRGNVSYGFNKTIIGFKVLRLILKKRD